MLISIFLYTLYEFWAFNKWDQKKTNLSFYLSSQGNTQDVIPTAPNFSLFGTFVYSLSSIHIYDL